MSNKNRQNAKKTTIAQNLNEITLMNYYNWLKLIALNIVKWENVPDTIDIRYLELVLFERGNIVFFEDSELGVLALPANLSGRFDVYGIPNEYYAYSAFNGFTNRNLNKKNSVLMFNNYLRTGSETIVQTYANKLANIDRSIDVNTSAQRTPVMVGASEQQKLTMRNIVADYDGNEPFIYLDNKIDLAGLKVFNTQAPYTGDKMESLLHAKLNDYLSMFGIENSNSDKKERMVSDEVNANYGLIELCRSIFLTPRQEGIDKVNKMFNINPPMKVSFNSELNTLINGTQKENDNVENEDEIIEGEENE